MKKWLLMTLVMSLLFACDITIGSEDDDDSSKGSEYDIPEGAEEVISDEFLEDLRDDAGMPLYEGSNPPDITGAYLTDSLNCIYDYPSGAAVGFDFNPYYWNFYSYDEDKGTIMVDYSMNDESDQASGRTGYLSGSGSDFMLIVDLEGSYPSYGIDYKAPYVFAGTVDSDGNFSEFYFAFVLTEKTNDDNDQVMMPVGGMRLFLEDDGLTEQTDWPF